MRRLLLAVAIVLPLAAGLFVVLVGSGLLQGMATSRYYAKVVRENCPSKSELVGRWRITPESVKHAVDAGADPIRTGSSQLVLSSSGDASLVDIPEGYFETASYFKLTPMTFSGNWFTSNCELTLLRSSVGYSHEIEREGSRLRVLFIRGDPDSLDALRYEREPLASTGNAD